MYVPSKPDFAQESRPGRLRAQGKHGRGQAKWWLDQGTSMQDLADQGDILESKRDVESCGPRLRCFGHQQECLEMLLSLMAKSGERPLGSMGNDTPPVASSELRRSSSDFPTVAFSTTCSRSSASLAGRSLRWSPWTPQAWENDATMSEELRNFYKYQAAVMEPWDGSARLALQWTTTGCNFVGTTSRETTSSSLHLTLGCLTRKTLTLLRKDKFPLRPRVRRGRRGRGRVSACDA